MLRYVPEGGALPLKHPHYQLRQNKAVDRLTLIDAIKRVVGREEPRRYTYYGMGGPYLEDFRMIYEFFPEMRMVSIEENEDTHKRQHFHLPCRGNRLKLKHATLSDFLAEYEAMDEKSVFWLDFTDLEFANLDAFMDLLGKVGAGSIVKITLPCNPPSYQDLDQEKQFKKALEFIRKFETLLPSSFTTPPLKTNLFALLVQDMVRIASQRALSSAMQNMFLPLCSFYYNDGTAMFSLTGLISLRSEEPIARRPFKNWQLANLDWTPPKEISTPSLSTKERLHLQRHLPRSGDAGKVLLRSLGYLIDEDKTRTEAQLQQYADFHRYFPYFVKAIP